MTTAVRYARKRLDLPLSDVAFGLAACIWPPLRWGAGARVESAWTPSDTVLPCLSVRSGFDLLLASVDWPPGSEVLMSAVTIPHCAALVRHHGYVPVAVDIDPATLEVDPGVMVAACTNRTRALLVAQLFGARSDLLGLAELARSQGLLLIEDCAQCYDGVNRALGAADVAMYSFGTIKTATCLGGAVLLVRNPALRDRMLSRQRAYPVQSSLQYASKLVRSAVLVLLGIPAIYARFTRWVQRMAGDYDHLVRAASRGFDDHALLNQIRHQPSPALIAMMARRFATYDPSRVQLRRQAGDRLASALGAEVEHLGGQGRTHTHWLFPVVSGAPEALVAAGRAAGFDLTCGSATLVCLDARCVAADRAMRQVVYLPVYDGIPQAALDELAAVVTAAERRGALSASGAG